MSIRPCLLRCGFSLLFSAAVLAAPAPGLAQNAAPPPVNVQTAQASSQGRFVQSLGDRAIAILADKGLSADMRSERFRSMLRESFDLPTIARFVIGRSWYSATPDQQKEYLRLFEQLVIKTYSDRFALYTGEGFHVVNVRPEGDKDFIVNSEITHPDGSPATTVDWRLHQKDRKLGIIDVVVEGVSMSITQRQEYAAIIQRNGGNIDALLDAMRQRVVERPATGQQ